MTRKSKTHYVDCNVVSLYVARASMAEPQQAMQCRLVKDSWELMMMQKTRLMATTALVEEAGRGNAGAARKRLAVIHRDVVIRKETKKIVAMADELLAQVVRKDPKKQAAERERLNYDARHYAGACILGADYLLTTNDTDFALLIGYADAIKYKGHRPQIEGLEGLFDRVVRDNPERNNLIARLLAWKSPWVKRVMREVERNQIALTREQGHVR